MGSTYTNDSYAPFIGKSGQANAGLPIARHRLFKSNILILTPGHPLCSGVAKQFATARGWEHRDMRVSGKGRRVGTSQRWSEILGIDWHMTQHELAEAIPPAYSEYIGRAAIEHIDAQKAAA